MNIYALKQDLLSIFDELEENGGEITPELEDALKINQSEVLTKVADYVKGIKILQDDIDRIKIEQKRLKDLADTKSKVIDKIQSIVIDAIEFFGDTKKSGVKYIDYGTGTVSIRRTKKVDSNDDNIKAVGVAVGELLDWYKFNNTINDEDNLPESELLDIISQNVEKHINGNEVLIPGVFLNKDDLDPIKLKVTLKVDLNDLTKGDKYNIIKDILSSNSEYSLESYIDKMQLKKELTEDGAKCIGIATLEENKTLQIK